MSSSSEIQERPLPESEVPLQTTVVERPAREPRPRPLIYTLLLLSFFGGTCSIQRSLGPQGELPSKIEVGKTLQERGALPAEMSESDKQSYVDASYNLMEEKARQEKRFQPFLVAFGLALAAAYSYVLVCALRARIFLPGSASQLSFAALLALAPRVSVAAVDTAIAQNLQGAAARLTEQLIQVTQLAGVPAPAMGDLANTVGWSMVAAEIISTVLICLLLTYAWRYFQRPEVAAYFEKRAPQVPLA